jgi:hypothetical protein
MHQSLPGYCVWKSTWKKTRLGQNFTFGHWKQLRYETVCCGGTGYDDFRVVLSIDIGVGDTYLVAYYASADFS